MELSEVVRRRHMVRSFEPHPIDVEVLERVLAAANRAPAAGNTQALDLLVLRGPTETARYWDVTLAPDKRATFRWPGLLQAPVLVLPCVRADAYVERYGEDEGDEWESLTKSHGAAFRSWSGSGGDSVDGAPADATLWWPQRHSRSPEQLTHTPCGYIVDFEAIPLRGITRPRRTPCRTTRTG